MLMILSGLASTLVSPDITLARRCIMHRLRQSITQGPLWFITILPRYIMAPGYISEIMMVLIIAGIMTATSITDGAAIVGMMMIKAH